MVDQPHPHIGHEFGQTLGDSEGQAAAVHRASELDMTEKLNNKKIQTDVTKTPGAIEGETLSPKVIQTPRQRASISPKAGTRAFLFSKRQMVVTVWVNLSYADPKDDIDFHM